MKRALHLLVIILFSVILKSCKSGYDSLKENKNILIQQAKSNAITSFSNAEIKEVRNNVIDRIASGVVFDMQKLNVDNVDISYNHVFNKINLDSVVVYYKNDYVAIYDFAIIKRRLDGLKSKSLNLLSLDKIENDFYIGKLKMK